MSRVRRLTAHVPPPDSASCRSAPRISPKTRRQQEHHRCEPRHQTLLVNEDPHGVGHLEANAQATGPQPDLAHSIEHGGDDARHGHGGRRRWDAALQMRRGPQGAVRMLRFGADHRNIPRDEWHPSSRSAHDSTADKEVAISPSPDAVSRLSTRRCRATPATRWLMMGLVVGETTDDTRRFAQSHRAGPAARRRLPAISLGPLALLDQQWLEHPCDVQSSREMLAPAPRARARQIASSDTIWIVEIGGAPS